MLNHCPMNAQLTEIMRLITNLIRTGVVTEVDRENWLCRVKTGELETNWISWLTLRAGKPTSVHAVSGTGQRHADTFRCSYAGDNRRQAVVAGTGADGRTGESMAPD